MDLDRIAYQDLLPFDDDEFMEFALALEEIYEQVERYARNEKEIPMSIQAATSTPIPSPVKKILLDRIHATWTSGENLEADRTDVAGARASMVKIENDSITSSRGILSLVHVLQYKRYIHFSKASGMHKFNWKKFSKTYNPKNAIEARELARDAELLALYSLALPQLEAHKEKFLSFKTYIDDPEAFIKDIVALLETPEHEVSAAISRIKELSKFRAPQTDHEFLITQCLGLDGTPPISISAVLTNIKEFNEKGAKMSTDRPQSFARKIGERAKEGAITGTIGALSKNSIQVLTEQMGDQCPEFLKTEIGQKALEGLLPVIALGLLSMDTENRLSPAMKSKFEALANRMFDSWSVTSSGLVVDKAFETFGPLIMQWMEAANKVEALTGESVLDEAGSLEVQQRARVAEYAAPTKTI